MERQNIQQKIQAEIQNQKEQHLTVYQKSSIDRGDEDKLSHEMATHMDVPIGDEPRTSAKKLKALVSWNVGS